VSKEQGGFLGSIRMAEALAAETPGAFLPRQFANDENPVAHATTTGPELLAQLRSQGLTPTAFTAGVGTGGTIMGVGRFLQRAVPGVRVHPVEPANSPTLSTGHKVGRHRIQGISDEFIPPIVQLDALDAILAIDDGDAIRMAQALAHHGLGVGISSGANFLAAVRLREELGDAAVVVTVFPDSNKKYLTTDLLRDEPHHPDHLAPRIAVEAFRGVNRVCEVCFDPADPASAPALAVLSSRRP
jgi:cysteine synthase A